MIDSGATSLFIHEDFCRQHKVFTVPLENPITVYDIDGTLNEAGSITRRVKLNLTVGSYTFKEEFLITNTRPKDVILGLPASIIHDTKDEVWILAGYTYSQAIAVEANRDKYAKTFKELVPKEYHQHKKVFSEEESQRLPKHQPWDHAIDLAPDAPPLIKSKVYPMSPIETEELKRFLEDALAKGYVVPSKSPMVSPVFFIKKKDGKLRFVQDYRKLNDITVKNRYPLPLAADIINKLQGAKIFTKFDVRWGYNNVRIKEGDEWKAAFVTNQGLFEPRIMYFGLCNSPATFQALMNHVFADLIAAGKVAVYLDDILIWFNDIASHRKIIHEVLEHLAQYDLYLRPEKCEFECDKIKYLRLLIREGQVGMDPAVTAYPGRP
ncbi:hypothetical protein PsYK624_072670 [Phanerochaete sordida]|uniref:Reverse transcriptase domain-containing protein n=1 Tax=Phanerochaete sordida TaxID=48140 RepID=A0A9P3GA36_9APHY|nr:hypothetical protein PsYK624_072670 [Phanerochaete sordida]